MRGARTLAALAGVAVAGCAPTYAINAPATSPKPPAAAPQAAAPAAPVQARRSPIPRPDVNPRDQCGANDVQGLVGRPRTEIPVPLNPNRQRVACTTCPVSQDYDPARLNFFFDRDSGVIREVRCG